MLNMSICNAVEEPGDQHDSENLLASILDSGSESDDPTIGVDDRDIFPSESLPRRNTENFSEIDFFSPKISETGFSDPEAPLHFGEEQEHRGTSPFTAMRGISGEDGSEAKLGENESNSSDSLWTVQLQNCAIRDVGRIDSSEQSTNLDAALLIGALQWQSSSSPGTLVNVFACYWLTTHHKFKTVEVNRYLKKTSSW